MSDNKNTALEAPAVNSLQADNVQLGGDLWANTQSFGLALRMANALAASTIIPKEYQGNPSNTLIALEMASRMGTSPMQVMQNLHVINNRPSWSSQYIIGVINASRKYKHELKFNLAGKGDSLSCFAWTTDQAGEKIDGPTITMEMAKKEGWLSRNGSKWQTMPEVMIRYRAAAFFGRLYCSDMIMGIYDRDEVIELAEDEYSFVPAQEHAEAVIAKNANAEVIDAGEVVQADPPANANGFNVDEATGEVLPWDAVQEDAPDPPEDKAGQQTLDGYKPGF